MRVPQVPHDRDESFSPQVLPKRRRVMDDIDDHVLSLYTHGMSTRDIENHIKELYGVDMSEATISYITDRIIEHIDQWKSRRLASGCMDGRSDFQSPSGRKNNQQSCSDRRWSQ
ncbi:transposase [Dyadobacter tibetensis]|uniref:transposase n=1 Tax=Dyadobacter tibetensis TaxID=1211851 RepID=UPI0009FDF79C